jgi:tRNA(adenine34) deaminase
VIAEVARHQSFDGFIRVEEAIGAKQKRQARGDGCERDDDVSPWPRRSRRHGVLWPRMDVDQLMAEALAQARWAKTMGEVPIGAVVAVDGEIVGRGFNHPISAIDPTAHAEIVAMREAATRLGNYRLTGATLCVTIEPCLMCVGAIVHARIGTVVFGAAEPRTGAVVSTVRAGELPGLNHRFEVVSGVREEDCRNLMVGFFKERR